MFLIGKVFFLLVQRHRIEGLVYDGLERSGVVTPGEIASRLQSVSGNTARQNLMFAAENLRLQRLFDDCAVPVLFIKGTTLAILAYHEITTKTAWDIDILVSPDDAEQGCKLLESAGYERILPQKSMDASHFRNWMSFSKECIFENVVRGTVVELHWRLFENPLLLPDISVTSPTQLVPLSPSRSIPTLQQADLFSYLCVHGATHGWTRLKWLADLAALLAPLSEDEVASLYRVSQVKGAGRCSAQALLLCVRIFEQKVPLELVDEIRRDRQVRWLESLALNAMTGLSQVEDRMLSNLPIRLSCFLFQQGWRYWFHELRSNATGWNDMMTLPLPRYLYFLYLLVRVPSWLWRRIILRKRPPLRR